jgi:large subunit ribosomal protein L13
MTTQESAPAKKPAEQPAQPSRPKKTFQVKKAEAQRGWFVVDVAGKVLGRAATQIAHVLRGKHKPTFTPHVDNGDFVVVINADKVVLTGNKLEDKYYRRHSNHPGGFREVSAGQMLQTKPEEIVRFAVKGMLPRGPLGRKLFKKLKVYAKPEHPHKAQKPQPLGL